MTKNLFNKVLDAVSKMPERAKMWFINRWIANYVPVNELEYE